MDHNNNKIDNTRPNTSVVLDQVNRIEQEKESIRGLFSEFMREAKSARKCSPVTLRGYQAVFDLFMKLTPNITLESIDEASLTSFFEKLDTRERIVGRGRVVKGIKKTTIATYWSKLHKFIKWLKKRKYIDNDPFEDMDFPRVYYNDRKFLKKNDVDSILYAVNVKIKWSSNIVKKRNQLIFYLALFTGIRKGELLNIRVIDCDLERKDLFVRGETSKSRKDRFIPINSVLFDCLDDYIHERERLGYQTPYLLISNNDKEVAFGESGLKHLIEIVKEKSGVRFHIHRFRHTFAVNLVKNGVDISRIKELLGHNDIRMTSVYLRCLPSKILKSDVESLTLEKLV